MLSSRPSRLLKSFRSVVVSHLEHLPGKRPGMPWPPHTEWGRSIVPGWCRRRADARRGGDAIPVALAPEHPRW